MTKETAPQPTPLSLEYVTLMAREVTLRTGEHAPTLIVDSSSGPVFVQFDALAPSHPERLEQMFSVGTILAREGQVSGLRQIFFICEAWMSVARNGFPPKSLPSQDPQRKEVLIISGYTPSTRQADLAMLEMIRDPDGILRELRELELAADGERQVASPLLVAFVSGFRSRSN